MIKNGILTLITLFFCVSLVAQPRTLFSGKVVSTDKTIVDFATVYLKGHSMDVQPTNEVFIIYRLRLENIRLSFQP